MTCSPMLKSYLLHLFWGLITLVLSALSINAAQEKIPSTGLQITNITVGEDAIATAKTQLIEVVLKNTLKMDIAVKVRLIITLPNRNVITFGNRRAIVRDKSRARVLFDYPVKKHLGGDYSVGAKVYASKSGKVLASTTKKQGRYFFAIDPTKSRRAPSRVKRKQVLDELEQFSLGTKENNEQAVQFDPPDLLWEELSVINQTSILRGETTHVRMILANQGGDVATDVEYSVKWYFSQREKRKKRIFWDRIKAIAPGERKVIELPITIPAKEQIGSYIVEVVVDEPNIIRESEENNNSRITNKPIIFSDVAQVFPEDSYSFAEDGLFRFEWRSRFFRQFKVQISTDKSFKTDEAMFEMPKGERWQSATSIKPEKGEMPTLALALMSGKDTDNLFWRIKAKNQTGKITYSAVRNFYINLKAE